MSLSRFKLAHLKTEHLGQSFFHIETANSTQTTLKDLIKQGFGHGTAVLCDHQLRGRGSKGRTWFKLPEPQIYLSVALEPAYLPVQQLPLVNIILGVVMVKLIHSLDVSSCAMKWPNDVYIDGKKVSGILSELIQIDNRSIVLVGIGVNFHGNLESFPTELRTSATILELHVKKPIDRYDFISNYFDQLESYFNFIKKNGIGCIIKDFEDVWLYKDHPIRVIEGGKQYSGVAHTIDHTGALQLDTGKQKIAVLSGDIVKP